LGGYEIGGLKWKGKLCKQEMGSVEKFKIRKGRNQSGGKKNSRMNRGLRNKKGGGKKGNNGRDL